jgi:integrase/recombinase XerC
MRSDRKVPGPGRRGRSRDRQYVQGPHLYTNRYGVFAAYIPKLGQRSLHTRDAAEAQQRFRALLDGRAAPGKVETSTESTLSAIADSYLEAPHGWTKSSQATTKSRALSFVEWFDEHGVKLPSQLSDEKLDAWIRDREVEASRATLNRDLVVARCMLRWARERGLCSPSPVEKRKPLREPRRKKRRVIVSHDDLAKVVAACRGRGDHGVALTLRAAALSGLRIDELRNLRPEEIDGAGVSVRPHAGAAADAWTGKSFRERRIPLPAEGVAVVKEFLAWRSGKGGKGKKIGLADTWLAKRIDKACEAAKVDSFRMHDLRRLFATTNVDGGVPVRVVSQWLGHADIATTERYIQSQKSDDELTAVIPVTNSAAAHKARIKRGR